MNQKFIMLLDMDCFYVQVEQRQKPESKNKPCIVVQYNEWRGGGIIAASYEARSLGIGRGIRGDDAKEICSDLISFKVPEKNGKADLTKYREAGAEVINCLFSFTDKVERASIDEAYVDLTDLINLRANTQPIADFCGPIPNSHIVISPENQYQFFDDPERDKLSVPLLKSDWQIKLSRLSSSGRELVCAINLAKEIRQTILNKTGFECSCGIAPNKTLAKLACTLNKPNKQTIVVPEAIPFLLDHMPIKKVRNFGGKLGLHVIEKYKLKNLGELSKISLRDLTDEFGTKTALWLHNISRGIEDDCVDSRLIAKSIGCSKNFMGKSMLKNEEMVSKWFAVLSQELVERIVKDKINNKRIPTKLSVHVRVIRDLPNDETPTSIKFKHPTALVTKNREFITSISRSVSTINLASLFSKNQIEPNLNQKISRASVNLIRDEFSINRETGEWKPPVVGLGLNAYKFEVENTSGTKDIKGLFDSLRAEMNTYNEDHPSSSTARKKVTTISKEEVEDVLIDSVEEILTEDKSELTNQNEFKNLEKIQNQSKNNVMIHYSENSNSQDMFKTKWMICDECLSKVSVCGFEEHKDFHLAMRIQKDWSREQFGPSNDDLRIVNENLKSSIKIPEKRGKNKKINTQKNSKKLSLSKQPKLDKFFIKSSNK